MRQRRLIRTGATHRVRLLVLILSSASVFYLAAAEPVARKVAAVTESELTPIERKPSDTFPWKKNQTEDIKPGPKPDNDTVIDVSSSDVVIKAMGDFTREEKDGKEVLTLNKDVEIEQLRMKSVLRGQVIRVVRDLKTGQTEMLEAGGGVEVVTPERKGRGQTLVYETKFSPEGQVLKDLYTLEGDRASGKKVTLWQGNDVIEAEKFVSDRRMDIFRVSGGPAAIVTIPGTPGGNEKKAAAGNVLPGFSVGAGNRISLRADGEMYYEGSSGRAHITRNVTIQQDNGKGEVAMTVMADEATLQLLLPPPGQPNAGNSSMFNGSLKSMEFNGRVEIQTASGPTSGQTVLCDRGTLDMQRKIFVMSMKNPKDDVRIYIRESASGGKVLLAPKSLTVNTETQEFHAVGAQRMEAFSGNVPSNRAVTPAPK